jgi:hypothetical protein
MCAWLTTWNALSAWSAEDWIALFSLFTGVAIVGQWTAMLRTNKHFRIGERSYVKMSHEPPGIKWESDTSGNFKVVLKITNHGRTPGNVTDVVTNFFLPPSKMRITELPPSVRHTFLKETKAFLVHGDYIYQHADLSVTVEERNDILAGRVVLIFYGYVDYIDQFNVRHRGGYGRKYLPTGVEQNLVFPDEGLFNYDRVRKTGEGIDWPSAV